MNEVQALMGREHDKLHSVLSDYQKHRWKSAAKQHFREFREGIRKHIIWEEEILYPLYEERNGNRAAGPTVAMRGEHQKILGLVEQLHGLISRDDWHTEQLESALIHLLSAHRDREESTIYPWMDESVSAKERLAAIARLRAIV